MSDDSRALATGRAPAPPTDAGYDAIHAALMETERGRAFLAEYRRRSRSADIAALIAASERIEATMREQRAAEPAPSGALSAASDAQVIEPTPQPPARNGIDARVPPISWFDAEPADVAAKQTVPAPAENPPDQATAAATAADELADLLFEPGMPAAPVHTPGVESKPESVWMPLDAAISTGDERPVAAATPADRATPAAKRVEAPPAPSAPRAGDPLAPLKAMSDEERIALFS